MEEYRSPEKNWSTTRKEEAMWVDLENYGRRLEQATSLPVKRMNEWMNEWIN
jgi:hypothetical protein